ncbi:hypothetical protein OFC49_28060, partial [Escherichia coli]|nr:hypothetical protein [Escherichia coli]
TLNNKTNINKHIKIVLSQIIFPLFCDPHPGRYKNLTHDFGLIYHNIPCPHRRRGPQRVSAACGPFPAPFPVHIVKKRA